MGSNLVEDATGRRLWGVLEIARLTARWRDGRDLATLAVTEDERDGKVGRIRPDGLLSTPEWAPSLGLEPYSNLMREIRACVVHPDAVLPFDYDWRLSVEFNAGLLAERLSRHLERWREHPAQMAARRSAPDEGDARVVLVAHSMGGLVAASMCARRPDLAAQVRASVTLGTPFEGAVKATVILNAGRGLPVRLDKKHMQELARTLPGLHDLLPTYRCLVTDDDVVALSRGDLAALGADPDLAERSAVFHRHLDAAALPEHTAVVGYGQETAQSLRLRNGTVEALFHGFRRDGADRVHRGEDGRPVPVDHTGDGTVFRYSATPPGRKAVPIVQDHGALAATGSALDIVRGVLEEIPRGSALDGTGVRVRVPDLVTVGEPFEISVDSVQDPLAVTCTVEDARHERRPPVDTPRLLRTGDAETVAGTATVHDAGLYRVAVAAGVDPVTRLVLAVPPASAA
ncbi:esterase/lipase family protein [Actinomadura mexicana]|nr:hypothetical protein [Actinomadura mexicana]